MSDLALEYSHASALKSLPQWLREERIPCLAGVDTRAAHKAAAQQGLHAWQARGERGRRAVRRSNRRDLVASVTGERIVYPGGVKTVVLVDCGAKASITHELRTRGVTVIREPSDYDFLAESFDAVLVSNGPGDPGVNTTTIRNLERAMRLGRPIMGICLGHQLLALAAGAKTYKLKFGHRGQKPTLHRGTDQTLLHHLAESWLCRRYELAARGLAPLVHVLSGAAMGVASNDAELERFLAGAEALSKKRLADLEIKSWQEYGSLQRVAERPAPQRRELKPAA